ncbi:hypothetical protein [Streptomyces sp. NBC_01483]|uniref:hypothetical protein n=1 Tax=Streptomyces sp. NBC_01483 TaxID=2903883 RepID=UPI002E3308F5|nr:hypothetical protein [Streptomyces sp. NBC_01483]
MLGEIDFVVGEGGVGEGQGEGAVGLSMGPQGCAIAAGRRPGFLGRPAAALAAAGVVTLLGV